MTLELKYELVGTGWCRCEVRLGESSVAITGSYLSDCLGDLASAVVDILRGDEEARFSFDEEPGEYRWIVTNNGDDIRVQILEFPELWGGKSDNEGKLLIDDRCSLLVLMVAVRDVLKGVLKEHGTTGYRDKWVEHDFPSDALDELNRHLTQQGV